MERKYGKEHRKGKEREKTRIQKRTREILINYIKKAGDDRREMRRKERKCEGLVSQVLYEQRKGRVKGGKKGGE